MAPCFRFLPPQPKISNISGYATAYYINIVSNQIDDVNWNSVQKADHMSFCDTWNWKWSHVLKVDIRGCDVTNLIHRDESLIPSTGMIYKYVLINDKHTGVNMGPKYRMKCFLVYYGKENGLLFNFESKISSDPWEESTSVTIFIVWGRLYKCRQIWTFIHYIGLKLKTRLIIGLWIPRS